MRTIRHKRDGMALWGPKAVRHRDILIVDSVGNIEPNYGCPGLIGVDHQRLDRLNSHFTGEVPD